MRSVQLTTIARKASEPRHVIICGYDARARTSRACWRAHPYMALDLDRVRQGRRRP